MDRLNKINIFLFEHVKILHTINLNVHLHS